jgi:hypothetical protein
MARGYDIGGLLARSGAIQGQQMAQGYNQLGQGLSGLFTGVADVVERGRERKQEAASQQQFQQLLERYKNDPAGMQREGLMKAASSNPTDQRLGQLLLEEAARIAGVQTAKTEKGTAQGIQGGLSAITQAAARGIPLADLQEGVRSVINLGGTQAQIMSAYQAGVDMAKGAKPKTSVISAGGALVSDKGEVLYERPFKPEAAPASKGIKTVERKDGSVSVLDANDGSLISTLPPPDTTDASQEASLNLIAKTTSFIKDVDDLMDPDFGEAGLVGGVLSKIPGSDAYDRERELLSIRARLGFEQIDEMKRLAKESGASGTGLGQISNIEFQSLQSTVDAIYVGMSAEAQNKALENIKKHLLNVQQLASGVAPADAIDWSAPEYKATGYHQDPETGAVFFAPNGRNGTVYKLVNGKFVKVGA